MSLLSHEQLIHLLATYGYLVIAVMVGLEGVGIPVPGEATLIAAAVFAARTHELALPGVIGAAVAGAILGDNAGFCLGRSIGYKLLVRYGPYVRLTESRLKLGQYLFYHHGSKVAFFGRFLALLRTLAPFVAGANRMAWRRFALFDAAGTVCWASIFGGGAFMLGREAHRIMGDVGPLLAIAAVALIIGGVILIKRNEARLTAVAEREFPGPLRRQPTAIV